MNRIKEELNEKNVKVIATGGLATLIAKSSEAIDIVDPMLTLKGLLVLYEKNKADKKERSVRECLIYRSCAASRRILSS